MISDIVTILKVSGIEWTEYLFDPFTIELAEFMHNQYEEKAKLTGWNTQENCKVDFEELPVKNQIVMLEVANLIVQKYIKNSF